MQPYLYCQKNATLLLKQNFVNTFIIQALPDLVISGTYPGAYISVKKEAQLTSSNPITTTTNLYQQSRVGHGSAFISHVPTAVAMAAASSVSPGQTHLPSVTGAAVSTVVAPLV